MSIESSAPTRGLFIVFEGGDGAGKTTQVAMAQQWLESRGATVRTTREPGGTQISEELRSLVLEHGHGEIDARTEALIYSAARAAHVQQVIRPSLEAGTHIICDRFVDSSLAYQGMGRELGFAAVASINDFATGGLKPDVTIILDISAEHGRARRIAASGGVEDSDRLEAEPDDFHERIRNAFLELAAQDPQRYLVLDATASVEQLHQSIVEHLAGLL
ncbi:dTMP kinase [Glutamicibacter arilaitensis]|uniref:Thymidylate kinase n=2 Tax=Glutamicibacter arilaitensis TaxID=256701 RepID=A0A2N7RZM1_9MICC|nr:MULTISPECIES: dTMP kinase [Glutamicibacter]PMQ19339.1 dTMP kinase [Glutamicibacter arilaitensis]TFH54395.1 dTMP kinase [Glutamicibacter arilaitensis]CBT74747.1 dTMP kinase [Glutamicibacter arilaitensis Re117]HCH48342.1 dTMP kinase [Glutamicibacter sp.]HCJ54318.1 dTMP kinase [Glutamicibacter sp.]